MTITGLVSWCSRLSHDLWCQHNLWVLPQVPTAPLLTQRNNTLEKQWEKAASHMGECDGFPCYWPWLGPVLAITAIWGVKWETKHSSGQRSAFLPSWLGKSAFHINKTICFKKLSLENTRHLEKLMCYLSAEDLLKLYDRKQERLQDRRILGLSLTQVNWPLHTFSTIAICLRLKL